MSKQMTLADLADSAEYDEFVEKFKPKKTTDDCLTPPEIYDVVADYVAARYGLGQDKFVRPFWPGGDYEGFEYPEGCVVVDNPPFSILSKIIHFYQSRGVRFWLFAPTLTIISAKAHLMELNHVICHSSITYENGAKVNTSFVTNLDTDGTVIESCPELSDAINAKDMELQQASKRSLPKYEYPDNVITSAKVNWYCAHHTPYKLNAADCIPISKLDAMGEKTIFGGGLLLSDRAAAERAATEHAAAERNAAIRYELSDREKKIVASLSRG